MKLFFQARDLARGVKGTGLFLVNRKFKDPYYMYNVYYQDDKMQHTLFIAFYPCHWSYIMSSICSE